MHLLFLNLNKLHVEWKPAEKKMSLGHFFPIMGVHLEFLMCVFDTKVASEWTFMVMTLNMAKSTEERVDDRIQQSSV